MQDLPFVVPVGFALTTLLSVALFLYAQDWRWKSLLFLLPWMGLQCALSVGGFYLVTDTLPPRFALAIGPMLLLTVLLFALPAGRRFLDGFDTAGLTLLHTVRVPVELVLYGLAVAGWVPELMTFEGRNFDILSGLSAPVVWWLGYKRQVLGRWGLVAWNLVCMGLLFNIVGHAILAAPSPFQQLAFDQPNVGVLHFPFIWLPSVVVPLVLFSHLVSLRTLLRGKGA